MRTAISNPIVGENEHAIATMPLCPFLHLKVFCNPRVLLLERSDEAQVL
ncbi:MAG: hypothetical protein SFY66_01335 [Oculatellaceae cyanobacterium bins.114]|nr:hypothetical protein [Oculatellaceae cyanobacterium bins.114]